MYDGLEEVFEGLRSSLDRFTIYLELPAKPNAKLLGIMVNVLTLLLETLALATRYIATGVLGNKIILWLKRSTKRFRTFIFYMDIKSCAYTAASLIELYGLALIRDDRIKQTMAKLRRLVADEQQIRGALTYSRKLSLLASNWSEKWDIHSQLLPQQRIGRVFGFFLLFEPT